MQQSIYTSETQIFLSKETKKCFPKGIEFRSICACLYDFIFVCTTVIHIEHTNFEKMMSAQKNLDAELCTAYQNYHCFLSASGDLLSFLMFEGQKKLLGCGLLGEISSQADTMNRCSINLKTIARKLNPSKIGERVHLQ